MELTALTSISPIDGRYRDKTSELSEYFSEFGLIRYRVQIEVEYFIELCELSLPQMAGFDKNLFTLLRDLYYNFTTHDAQRIKDIEKNTNHDVKAVEYFLKEKFDNLGLSSYKEFIHFGLTSQDINNTAIPLSLKEAVEKVYYPSVEKLQCQLYSLVKEYENIPMLAHTHGQPASPTRLGKEIKVFAERVAIQIGMMKQVSWSAKFGGATGNFNAHAVAYPKIDWVAFANKFVEMNLGLNRSQTTTQIEHYDNLAALFDAMKRINTILIDFSRDMWTYISMDYFKQQIAKNETGSSAMPHKVNPIDFENAEGNLGVANAMFEHLSAKLPISRLQRDLTDSTVTRNVGVPIAHTLIALKSLNKGLSKVYANTDKINSHLEANWAVVAEGVQTILRREGYPNPYEALKDLTRTCEGINANTIKSFIDSLNISENVKAELRALTPHSYTGLQL